jgi:uncharacterized protein YebE (UPF0316 family)
MLPVLLTCLLIIVARLADVSLATIRTIMTIQGRKAVAISISIFELLIWVFVVSRVMRDIGQQPAYGFAYAFGFALGTWSGMTIEARLALGRQVVRIITRQGPELATVLRDSGLRVTQFDGHGRDGPVQELFIEVERRQAREVIAQARERDPRCYYMVDDIRDASSAQVELSAATGWRSILKRK